MTTKIYKVVVIAIITMIDKKKLIINFLKRNGRSSTSRIAQAIKSNVWMANEYLKVLESEKKIIKEVETNATYWKLRGKKNG